jgi:2,3-bisphosphoglycerate-dependent phosphoglycerate mutase
VVTGRLDLWLVRHGATEWNLAGRLVGWSDVGLSLAGRRQARRLRPFLDRIGSALVWSSDLRRATQTAHLAGLDPAVDRRLREMKFGELEGRTWTELDQSAREGILRVEGFRAPGGESFDDLRDRVMAFVDDLADGRHIIVSHGGPLRTLLRQAGRAEEVPPGGVRRLEWSS